MAAITARANTAYCRRPRRGDQVETFVGPATVTAVHDRGRRLEVLDSTGRTHQLERAPIGWWLRVTEGS